MAVTKSLTSGAMMPDRGGLPIIPFPGNVNHYAVTTAKTITPPTSANCVILMSDADAWVAPGTAAVPAGDVTDGSGSFFLQAGVWTPPLATTDAFTVISAAGTAHVSACWYILKQS